MSRRLFPMRLPFRLVLPTGTQAFFAAAYLMVVSLLMVLVFQYLQQGSERRSEFGDHRQANQSDHDCIVALALLLADPKRDRSKTIVPPLICRESPAKGHVDNR